MWKKLCKYSSYHIRTFFLSAKMEKLNIIIPENFENLSREELISVLKNIKNQTAQSMKNKRQSQKNSTFDFRKYKKRHVALKFLYLGWDYSGFAVQNHSEKTIEEQLFNALQKTKLLELRETSNYHRCGRTDKGVSAFSQVISLDLRSNLNEGKGVITPDDYMETDRKVSDKEIDYTGVLNRVLPPEIRVIAWAPVDTNFSARFDCTQRTYKYWFPVGNLDINKMLEAGKRLIGEHDFRNFCKMDVANGVINYVRKILHVDIKKLCLSDEPAYDIAELTVVGQAFLYHQIRCIVSLLCLIGLGKENLQVIDALLDVSKCPRKPQYNIASGIPLVLFDYLYENLNWIFDEECVVRTTLSYICKACMKEWCLGDAQKEIPLVLFDCSYENLNWIFDEECVVRTINHLQSMWAEHSIKSVIIRKMLAELEKLPVIKEPIISQDKYLLPGVKPRVYKRLLDRPCCESLEERIEHFSKKQKLKLSDSCSSNIE